MYIAIKEIFRRFAAKTITEAQNILICKGREKEKGMPGRNSPSCEFVWCHNTHFLSEKRRKKNDFSITN